MTKEKHAEYFEGILQLRNVTQKVYDWVYDTMEKDGKAKVAKEKILKEGYDLYLSDQHYLQALGKKMKMKFPGETKTSMRIHTRDRMTHKALYRVTVLFRGLLFDVGDVLHTDEGDLQVLHIGNRIQVKDLASGKKKEIRIDDADRYARRSLL
ncbi:MAG: NMD3-related protein [Nanoarchaeota archaeon]